MMNMAAFPMKKVFTPKHHVIFSVAFFILILHTIQADQGNMSQLSETQVAQFAKNSGLFAIDVYSKLKELKKDQNIVFSPFSIQTCVAMARVGAEGETAAELDRGLRLISNDVSTIADSFSHVLEHYANSDILKIANHIYVMKGFHIRKTFQDVVSKKFHSGAEEIDFGANVQAAATINSWVSAKTNNLIKDVLQSSDVDSSTRLVLLNAIHFKGLWKHKFPKENTRDEDFYLNENDKVQVPMMNVKDRFLYADIPELDATVLDMPYKDSDLSMLVILPNSRTGLKDLEEKLKTMPLNDITNQMYSNQVVVKFPKFKAEFSVELKAPMQQLGMARMFSGQAEFGQMLEEPEPLTVSKVIHKAFIDVNEEGTEAAAVTVKKTIRKRCIRDLPPPPREFIADHPFFYIIYTSNIVNDCVANDDIKLRNLILFAGSIRTSSNGDVASSSLKNAEHDEL